MKNKLFAFALASLTALAPLRGQDAASTPFHDGSAPVEATPAPAPITQPTPAPSTAATPKETPAAAAVKAEETPRATPAPAPETVKKTRSSAPASVAKPSPKTSPKVEQDEPAPQLRDDSSSASNVVKALEKEWEASLIKHDPSVIERLVADDFVGVSSSGKIGDKVALIYEIKRDKSEYKTAAARQLSVRMYGAHVAVALGITREAGTDASGRAFEHTFRFVDTWMERGGKWQCIAAHAAAAGRP